MAQDRWRREWDEDRFRDQDYGRGGEFQRDRDFERGGYGRGGSWESGGSGYGGGRDQAGRDFGGYGFGAGYRSGERGFEGGYRGGFGGRGGRDFEFGGGYRGDYGNFGRNDWDRAYGAGGYSGMRGQNWGSSFGSTPDYGRWDWNRGESFGGSDYRGDFRGSDYDRSAAYGYGSRREAGWHPGSDYERGAVYGPRGERGFWDRASDEVSSWFGDEDAERRRRMDQFRGRGPKGYTRSDERIREDVSDRLTDDWRVDASNIEIKVSNGEVTLSGTVDSRDAKRRAEDIAESVSGARHVQNNLRVSETWSGSSGFAKSETGAGTTGATGTATSSDTTSGRRKSAL
jgi:osmotically-inducible protein OsmY